MKPGGANQSRCSCFGQVIMLGLCLVVGGGCSGGRVDQWVTDPGWMGKVDGPAFFPECSATIVLVTSPGKECLLLHGSRLLFPPQR